MQLLDIEELRRSADAWRFIADAGMQLSESLNLDVTLQAVAHLGCERGFADFCYFDVLTNGVIKRVACEHANPARAADMARLRTYAPSLDRKHTAVVRALTSRRPVLISRVDDAYLKSFTLDEEHLAFWRGLGPGSLMSVPVMARGEVLGTLTFVRTTTRPPFDERDLELAQALCLRAGVAIHNARHYERQYQVAMTLQYALLPGSLPKVENLAFDSVYRPASTDAQLGGDWYDAFELGDGRVAISVGDVTGHGLNAATTMVRAREALRAATIAEPDRPDLVLQRADRAMSLPGSDTVVTALVGVIDPRDLRFIYSSAGHPPPALRRGSEVRILRGGGVPLGVAADAGFAIHHVSLRSGDLLALYTDGLTEAGHDPVEGERAVVRALARRDVTASSLVDEVVGQTRTDDVAVLLVRVALGRESKWEASFGATGWFFSAQDASDAQTARGSFASYLRARGTHEADIMPAEVAFGELVGNVVRHAPGPIGISLAWRGPRPTLRVTDRGPGFDLPPPALPPDPLAEHGRGLFLVQALGTTLRFERAEHEMTVVAELPIYISIYDGG